MGTIKKIFKGFYYCFANINENNWVYKITALTGLIIRVVFLPFLLPDVFEVISRFFIGNLNFQPWLYELVVRLILLFIDALALSNLFYWISYFSVGSSYDRGTKPWWGSVCYTVYYAMYMAISIIFIQNFYWWVIVICFIIYFIVSLSIYLISSKLHTMPDNWIFRLILHIILFIIIVVGCCCIKYYWF